MKFGYLFLIAILPLSAQAKDQESVNSIYADVGQKIIETLDLEEVAQNEISVWNTDADQSKEIQRCYRENGLGRKSACVKAYQKMGLQLNLVPHSLSWKFMYNLSDLSKIAKNAIRQIDQIEGFSDHEYCNSNLRIKLEDLATGRFLNEMTLSDDRFSTEMDTEHAMSFLKMVTKNGRLFSQYLNQDQPGKDFLIERGREIHLAVRVIRSTLLNEPVSEEMQWAAEDLLRGCSKKN